MFQQKLLTKTFLATAMMGTIALTGCSKPAEKAETATSEPTAAVSSGDTIKVGILHSLSGTMAISETGSIQAEQLAIDQIKATLNKPSKISAQTWMTQFFGLLCLSRGPFGQFAGR